MRITWQRSNILVPYAIWYWGFGQLTADETVKVIADGFRDAITKAAASLP